jgi:pimeloyl-ACP methyl ester carboxylesterase
MPHSGFAPVDGTHLYYEISGSGPVVTFLHGRGANHRMWDDQVPPLAERYTVLSLDMRGFGQSPPGENGYSYPEDLAQVLDHLGIDRIVPVGLSLGGGVAVNFAVLYPQRTRALVAVDSSLGGYAWSREFGEMMGRGQRVAQEQGAKAANQILLDAPIMDGLRRRPEAFARMLEIMRDYSGWHWLHEDRGRPLTPPAIERLTSIRVPTLVIVGEHDMPDFHAIADTLAQRIPGARKVLMAAVGHCVNMEAPEEFNRTLLDFLDHVPA